MNQLKEPKRFKCVVCEAVFQNFNNVSTISISITGLVVIAKTDSIQIATKNFPERLQRDQKQFYDILRPLDNK